MKFLGLQEKKETSQNDSVQDKSQAIDCDQDCNTENDHADAD